MTVVLFMSVLTRLQDLTVAAGDSLMDDLLSPIRPGDTTKGPGSLRAKLCPSTDFTKFTFFEMLKTYD